MNRRGFFRIPLLGFLGVAPKSVPAPPIVPLQVVTPRHEMYVSAVSYHIPHTSTGLQNSAGEIISPNDEGK